MADTRTDDELIDDLLSALEAALVCVVSSLVFGVGLAVVICSALFEWTVALVCSFVVSTLSFIAARGSITRVIDYTAGSSDGD